MHLAQAKLRAIERGRYIARSASTGISAIINANGQTLDSVSPLAEGYAVEEIDLRQNKTLYSCIGNAFVYVLIFAVCAVITTDASIKIKEIEAIFKQTQLPHLDPEDNKSVDTSEA
jgi:apolipoprotein N-acyltransferase